MSVAILIPSHNRPHKIESLIKNIRENTKVPHQVYFCFSDDESVFIAKELQTVSWDSRKLGLRNYTDKLNFMYHHTLESFVYAGADDIVFTPNWDTEAMKHIDAGAKVVSINDLLNPIGTNFLAVREYLEKKGGVADMKDTFFYPDYEHNWAYDEVRFTAIKRGVYAHADTSIVEHQHYTNGKSKDDATYKYNREHDSQDKRLFESRRHLWESL